MVTLLNFAFFQVAWFAGVLGAAHGTPWLGPLVVLALVGYHLTRVPNPQAEAVLLALAATIGLLFDSLLVSSGWITYPAGQWHPMLAPYWIVTLWIAFATTLNVSLGWLRGRSALALFFGATGGPLSFLAGAKLGAATFINQPAALAIKLAHAPAEL